MDDKDIIELYWKRLEQAISETDIKYGKLCLDIAKRIVINIQDAEEWVNVNVNGGSVNATGNYLYAISIGNTSDSSKTGNSVIVQNATIVGNILSIDSEILETNEIVIPLTYKDDIVDEGFGYVTNNEIENTIKVKKAESKTEG